MGMVSIGLAFQAAGERWHVTLGELAGSLLFELTAQASLHVGNEGPETVQPTPLAICNRLSAIPSQKPRKATHQPSDRHLMANHHGVRVVYGWRMDGVRIVYGYCADIVRMVYVATYKPPQSLLKATPMRL